MQEEVVIDSWVFPINRCLSERGRDLSMAVSLPVCRSTLSMKGPKCSSSDTPSLPLQRHLQNLLFYRKGLRVCKKPLPFAACAQKAAILREQIWSAHESDVVGLRGFRIEFAYQDGPYGLKLRGQLGVDLD